MWAWGNNGAGQLGDGTVNESSVPIKIKENVRAVSAGGSIFSAQKYTMAVTENGELWAWGFNAFGNLGDGTFTDRLSPVKITVGIEEIVSPLGDSDAMIT